MALTTRAIVGLFPSLLRCHLPPPPPPPPPPPLKRNEGLLFSSSKRGCSTAGTRLSWSGAAKRMPEFARFASNSDQKPEECGGEDPSGDALFPPDDADYQLKLVAGSVGGAAAIKYGSILFPNITRPNLVQAVMMISLPLLVAAIILIKESYSGTQSEDLF